MEKYFHHSKKNKKIYVNLTQSCENMWELHPEGKVTSVKSAYIMSLTTLTVHQASRNVMLNISCNS